MTGEAVLDDVLSTVTKTVENAVIVGVAIKVESFVVVECASSREATA